MCKLIQEIIGDIKNQDVQKGMLFVGKRGAMCIDALVNPTTKTIYNVPVDNREVCKSLLLRSLERPDQGEKLPLLCNAGSAGSGKSVVLGFNLHWFVENKKGLGFELTFNDDQACMWKRENIITVRDLEEALAVRIIHRLLERCKGTSIADVKLSSISPLLKSICVLEDPFEAALRIVRRVLGVSENTKIMLGVDELSKAGPDVVTLLKYLTSKLDKDPELFLSVTAYGCVNLSTFATDTKRRYYSHFHPHLQ